MASWNTTDVTTDGQPSTQEESVSQTIRRLRRREILARALSIVLLLLQGSIIDYYLMNEGTSAEAVWIVTDVLVLLVWISIMILSFKRRHLSFDEMSWAFVAWIVYALHLAPQMAILCKQNIQILKHSDLFGPVLFKANFSLTPLLFVCLMFSHQNWKPRTKRKMYLDKIVGAVVLDLFDSIEMIQYLFDGSKITLHLSNAIISLAVINLFIPTLALIELKVNKFTDSGEVSSVSFKLLYTLALIMLVDVPFLVIRVIMWTRYNEHSSVLIAKNVIAILLAAIGVVDFFQDPPKRCEFCKKNFVNSSLGKHKEKCGSAPQEMAVI